jgi:hypothetical protein
MHMCSVNCGAIYLVLCQVSECELSMHGYQLLYGCEE